MDSFSKDCYDSKKYNEHNIFFNEYLSKYEDQRLKLIDKQLVNDLYNKIESERISTDNNENIKSNKIKNEVSLSEKIFSLENACEKG